MRKAWVYQRQNRPGYWVGWYDSSGKRHSKKLPNKSLADGFVWRIEHQLNEDIYPDPVAVPWDTLVSEYLEYKEAVRSLAPESLRSIKVTLAHFKALHGPVLSTKVNQRLIDKFTAYRLKAAKKPTVNKELRNLRAFIRWSIKNRYMAIQAARIEWLMQREAKRPVKAITAKQLNNLLIAAKKYSDTWYIRVLLAVSSGLRKGDIEHLQISRIDFEAETINTFSQKTQKGMPNRPLHPKAIVELSKYLSTIPAGQTVLFADKFHSSKWGRIRKQAGLPKLKFHDLRIAFASFIAQAGFSNSVTQALLEHSTPRLTEQVYTDVEPVYRKAIDAIAIPDIIIE